MGFNSRGALQPVHGLEITPLEPILRAPYRAYRLQHRMVRLPVAAGLSYCIGFSQFTIQGVPKRSVHMPKR